MNPKQFLLVGGIVLILVGILGFMGVIGPTENDSLFGATWWFDNGENWAHLLIGIVALIAAFALPMSGQKPLVMIVGVVALLIGLYSIFQNKFLGANLENPADTLLHLVIGVWALGAGSMKPKTVMPPAS